MKEIDKKVSAVEFAVEGLFKPVRERLNLVTQAINVYNKLY